MGTGSQTPIGHLPRVIALGCLLGLACKPAIKPAPPLQSLYWGGVTTWHIEGSRFHSAWISLGVGSQSSGHLTITHFLRSPSTGRTYSATITYLGNCRDVGNALEFVRKGLSSLYTEAPDAPSVLRPLAMALVTERVRFPVEKWRSNLAWDSRWDGKAIKLWRNWCERSGLKGDCVPGTEVSGQFD